MDIITYAALKKNLQSSDSGGGIFNFNTATNDIGQSELSNCTFADILESVQADKLIMYGRYPVAITNYSDTQVQFVCWSADNRIDYVVSNDNIVNMTKVTYYLSRDDEQQTISASSTHNQIPTAKAVYDFIDGSRVNSVNDVTGIASNEKWVSAKLLYDYVELCLERHGLI